VVSVRSSVVDIRFDDHLPPIYSLLHTKDGEIAIEVLAQLDAHPGRGIALTPHPGPCPGHGGIGVFHKYTDDNDRGRFKVTYLESDNPVFKVPTLRNVTHSAPYFRTVKWTIWQRQRIRWGI
jgi:hypothetical protein